MKPDLTIVVPAYNEGPAITGSLDALLRVAPADCEVLVVYDAPDDTTAPHAAAYAEKDERVVPTVNTYGRGPANAIRFGIDHAEAAVVVVTMADMSDEVAQIPALAQLINEGAVIAAASRYMPGGRQVGGPRFKGLLSRLAGLSLHRFAGVATRDPTNSFKAYSTEFVRRVGIESRAGFELGIELVAKAHRLRLPIREIPTVWHDRTAGTSNFKLGKWLPKYLRWYLFAFGRRLDVDQLHRRARAVS